MSPSLEIVGMSLLPLALLMDLAFRARRFQPNGHWRVRALLVSGLCLTVSTATAGFWGFALDGLHLFDLSGLGTWSGAAVAILVYEFIHYWYHRSTHRVPAIFRLGHQMHHSAESLDAFGAYYLHPLDIFFFTTWSSLVIFPLLGVSLDAGIVTGFFLLFNRVFQHVNLRTPRWLGYFIQRPESHSVHHQRGVHRYNYADLPLWDMCFGTFVNPREFVTETGFWPGASARLADMLLGRNVMTDPRKVGLPTIAARTRPDPYDSF